jgi:hypothetical protein
VALNPIAFTEQVVTPDRTNPPDSSGRMWWMLKVPTFVSMRSLRASETRGMTLIVSTSSPSHQTASG